MAIAEGNAEVPDNNAWGLCRMPFWQTTAAGGDGGGGGRSSSSSSAAAAAYSSTQYGGHRSRGTGGQQQQPSSSGSSGSSVSSMAKSLLPTKRRLSLDPATKLYFPYEPGKQVRSAIRIKNIRKSHAAFKFQTTAPKSCFMRPPGGILAPGESIIATVFKFVEAPEDNESQPDQKCNVKFKIMSLKVKPPIEYVPELFDEQKDQASVEQILRVVFLDVERPCREMEKLKSQLAEAEAALEARKKPSEEIGSKIAGEGLVIDEWKERRERYLARQQGEGVDST